MSEAFDCINRNMLYYELLTNNINSNFYCAVLALYRETESCVQLNNFNTDWFETMLGVRQGDNLSPTLFTIYLNDLAIELKDLILGITLGDMHICILMYADDIGLVSKNEQKLQTMLNHENTWCYKWQMKVNTEKTKVVHF